MSMSASTTSVVQSGVVYDDSDTSHDLTPSGEDMAVYKQVFGERISSLREYLHRSSLATLYHHTTADATAALAEQRTPLKRLPPVPGVVNNGWFLATTSSGAGQRANFCKFHPLLSIGSCFVGYKGSVNITVNVDQPRNTPISDTLSVTRLQAENVTGNGSRRPNVQLYGSDLTSAADMAYNESIFSRSAITGGALTNTKTNTGMVVQLPYYSGSGFSLMDPYSEYNNQDTLTDRNNDWWEVSWRCNKNTDVTSFVGTMASYYYATGPDFDFVFFLNVPILTSVSVTAV
jgi:hypothetical protein